jgi:hypothetical protein
MTRDALIATLTLLGWDAWFAVGAKLDPAFKPTQRIALLEMQHFMHVSINAGEAEPYHRMVMGWPVLETQLRPATIQLVSAGTVRKHWVPATLDCIEQGALARLAVPILAEASGENSTTR